MARYGGLRVNLWISLLLFGLVVGASARAQEVRQSLGQVLFLPVYSEINYGDRNAVANLTVQATIRNLDPEGVIQIKRVDYLDAKGVVVRSLLGSTLTLKSMAAETFLIKESDRSGGKSPGILIEWGSEGRVVPPLVLGVMVNASYNQGMALTTVPAVVAERP